MVTCLGYGLALGAAHSVWPIAAVWRGPIVSILLSALASAVAAILTSWLVLPSLASDAVGGPGTWESPKGLGWVGPAV